LNVPWGLETDYSPGWVGRYQALRSKLTTFDIQPTVAYRLWDRLSLGVSLDIEYASARLSQAIDFGALGLQQALTPFFNALPTQLALQGVPATAIPGVVAATERAFANNGFVPQGRDGVSELSGSDWSVGFMLGGIFEYLRPGQSSFFQEGRIGVSYRSGITHDIQGSVEFRGVPALTAPGSPVSFPAPGAFAERVRQSECDGGPRVAGGLSFQHLSTLSAGVCGDGRHQLDALEPSPGDSHHVQ